MKILHNISRSILIFLSVFSVSDSLQAQSSILPNQQLEAMPFQHLLEKADSIYIKDHKIAYALIDFVINRAEKENNISFIHKGYFAKATYLERQLCYQAAYDNYHAAFKAVERKDLQTARNVQVFMGNSKRELFQYSEARDIYLQLLTESVTSNDNDNIQNAYCALGILYYTIEDYDNAIKYYEKAVSTAENAKNTVNQAIYLDNLSEVYCLNKQFDAALYHIEKAMQLADKDQDNYGKIFLYERYGRIFADMGRFDEAHLKFEAAIALCPEFGEVRDMKNLAIAKAELYLKEGKTALAEATFKETLSDISIMNVNNLIKVYHELGKIYKQRQDFNEALVYFGKSQKLATENLSLRYEEWNHRALYEIYGKKKQATQALFHLEKANALHDSLFSYEKMERVTELQFKYDYAQSQQLLKEKEIQNSRMMLYGGIIITILIVSFLGYFLHARNKSNQHLRAKNQQIQAQNLQLEAFNQEIKSQKQQLEDSNAMLKQFNYAVAHDLKEPLRGIGNFVKVIQRRYIKDLPDEALEYFDFVTSGVSRMGGMLDGLLKYSMISMNQVTEIEDVALNEIMNDVTASLQLKIAESHAEIIIPENMPMAHINKTHAMQLIQNLVSNALKFVEKNPKIEIETKENQGYLLISIRDNGIGISKEGGAKLFQLFNRVHSDTSRFEGTGIGLALCKSIVEKYKGKIWFESELNQGTQFFIELPKVA